MDELWRGPSSTVGFAASAIASLPPGAQRYLCHAFSEGTIVPKAVRLRMHGTIRLGRTWHPFEAEQVITLARGFLWSADVRLGPIHVKGYDRFVDGEGAMRWDLFGHLPVVRASSPDIDRSAAGRFHGELVLLPSGLMDPANTWTETSDASTTVTLEQDAEVTALALGLDRSGALRSFRFPRWGNVGGGPFRVETFGGIVEAERSFGGITLPSRLRIGWLPGTTRFASEGEFFRVTIDDAAFR